MTRDMKLSKPEVQIKSIRGANRQTREEKPTNLSPTAFYEVKEEDRRLGFGYCNKCGKNEVNVLNGLTPNSSFGQGIIMRTVQAFHAEDAETLISKIELNTLGKTKSINTVDTPVGRLMNKGRL